MLGSWHSQHEGGAGGVEGRNGRWLRPGAQQAGKGRWRRGGGKGSSKRGGVGSGKAQDSWTAVGGSKGFRSGGPLIPGGLKKTSLG